ncbi:hypothetical protein DYB37_013886 [Aphanomyces astaci]|uniref:Uncharacterized protein n=3 Tax=Aphanomyces astaci TaxID=112090 RepID=A0A397FFN4_APHAT|nr:hypothetical protein DYB36_011547 [Aphanomyces astaci]RHY48616.1 hypothetical protein DYB30_011395 [Aphanomyces astaci]RHZ23607.1 hypothetical protein DYB31_014330 [Aphanomyces astaci]RHZ31207.1 hypothetical protein DYB37_013886 [Aphanomyces astaci]
MLTWTALSTAASVGLFHGIRTACVRRLQWAVTQHQSTDGRKCPLARSNAPVADVAMIAAQCAASTVGLLHVLPLLPPLAEYVVNPQHVSLNYTPEDLHTLFVATLLVVGGYIWSLLFAPKSITSVLHHTLLVGLVVAATTFQVAVQVAAVYTVSTLLTMQPVSVADALFRAKSSWAPAMLRTALVYYGVVKAVAAVVLWTVLAAQPTDHLIAQGLVVWILSIIQVLNFIRMADHYAIARTWQPDECATSDAIIATALGVSNSKSLKH